MMMAKDSPPPRPQLSGTSIQNLKDALRDFLADGGDNPGASLQTALTRVASEARDKQMQAEQLLVALKDTWFALPEVAALRDNESQNRALQRVVSLCIREYYLESR